MERRDVLTTVWERMRAHPMQAFLSLLAIAVGIFALMGVVSFIEGVEQVIQSGINLFSPRAIVVARMGMGFASESTLEEWERRPLLTEQDAAAIREHAAAVEAVGFIAGVTFPPVTVIGSYRGTETKPLLLRGVDHLYLNLAQLDLAEGRGFTEAEVRAGRRVVILGHDVVQTLFPGRSPLGETVRLDGIPFRVIGVLPKLPSLGAGDGPNSLVLIPYTVFRRYYPDWRKTLAISVLARSDRDIWQAVDQVVAIMRWRHRLRADQENDFEIITQQSLVEFWQQIKTAVNLTLILVSSVALLVGGVGITAVMMVSVTERTREIGLRKAMGARPRDIAYQFLAETLTLTGTGGVLGILFSYGLLSLLKTGTDLPIALTAWPMLVGLIASSLTGLAAGLYPALKAARLDPVEALRYE